MQSVARRLIEAQTPNKVTRLQFDQDGYWVSPQAEIYSLDYGSHEDWAHKHLKRSSSAALAHGWCRVATEVDRGERKIYVQGDLKREQRHVLELAAIQAAASLIWDDDDHKFTTLYSPPPEPELNEGKFPSPVPFRFGRNYWIDPDGRLFESAVDGVEVAHETWALSLGEAGRMLYTKGWRRLVSLVEPDGRRTIYVRDNINRYQSRTLVAAAIESNAWLFSDTNRMRSGLVGIYQPPPD